MIEINLDKIEDPILKEFAQRVREEFKNQTILSGQWRFIELSFAANINNAKVPHKLKFRPKDVIQTSKTGTGTLTWNYADFDITNLDVTTAGTLATDPLVVRAFVGRYEEGSLV